MNKVWLILILMSIGILAHSTILLWLDIVALWEQLHFVLLVHGSTPV